MLLVEIVPVDVILLVHEQLLLVRHIRLLDVELHQSLRIGLDFIPRLILRELAAVLDSDLPLPWVGTQELLVVVRHRHEIAQEHLGIGDVVQGLHILLH